MTAHVPLLTIGIPTWNRSSILPDMVRSVCKQADELGLSDEVEVLISDNASTDDTEAIVQQLQQATATPIRYHRNEVNKGVTYNILKTVELASGEYWMFYGDDDLLPQGHLAVMLEAIRSHRGMPVFIFQSDSAPAIEVIHESVEYSMEAVARKYIYHMGNAGLQAVNTAAAQVEVRQRDINQFQSAWPQTQLAFHVMTSSQLAKPAIITPVVSVSSPHHRQHTTYTAWYMGYSAVFSLYDLALRLRTFTHEAVFQAVCDFIFELKRILLLGKLLLLYTAYSDFPKEVANVRRAAWKSLRQAIPQTFLPLAFLWLIVVTPHFIKLTCLKLIGLLPSSRVRNLNDSIETMRQYGRERRAPPGTTTPTRIYNPGDI